MRIIHITHATNRQEAIILTDQPSTTTPREIAASLLGGLGQLNYVSEYTLTDPKWPTSPSALPLDTLLYPQRHRR